MGRSALMTPILPADRRFQCRMLSPSHEPVQRPSSPRQRGAAGPGPPAGFQRRDRLAQLGATDAGRAARAGRRSSTSGRTPASTGCGRCPTCAPGTRSTGRRADRHRRPHAGVRLRARSRQRRRAVARTLRRRVPDRGRQRLRRLARRSPITTGRRSTSPTPKADPVPPLRRGRVRHDTKWSSSSC